MCRSGHGEAEMRPSVSLVGWPPIAFGSRWCRSRRASSCPQQHLEGIGARAPQSAGSTRLADEGDGPRGVAVLDLDLGAGMGASKACTKGVVTSRENW